MTETLANWCSSESTEEECSNEYQHGSFWMAFISCIGVMTCIKIAAALKGLKCTVQSYYKNKNKILHLKEYLIFVILNNFCLWYLPKTW